MVETVSKVELNGGCHCGVVRFTLKTTAEITVYKCNCSICYMRQNHHFVVPKSDVELTIKGGEEEAL